MKVASGLVIAIDGTSGSGKSTLAKLTATSLSLAYLDTGAMYRCVGLKALEEALDLTDHDKLIEMARGLEIQVGDRVSVDGVDVTSEIRTPQVSQAASVVATVAGVREEMVSRQRSWIEANGPCVVEGRDIGSVVWPDAQLKVFLDASSEVRAKRRADQLGTHQEITGDELRARDLRDQGRRTSPLEKTADSVVIDTSQMALEDTLKRVITYLKERQLIELDQDQPDDESIDQPTQSTLTSLEGKRAKVEYRPPTKGSLVFFSVCRAIAVTICRIYCRVSVEGRKNLPESGPYIIAPVHRSYVDWIVLGLLTRRRIRFMAKDTLWSSRFIGWLLGALGTFPVHRASADRSALTMCVSILKEGEPCVLFPEGQRMTGPNVARVFDGASYVAAKAQVPIVPVGIGGSERVMQKGKILPRPYKVHIIVGTPIAPPANGKTGKVSRKAVKESSLVVQDSIQKLFDRAQRKVGL